MTTTVPKETPETLADWARRTALTYGDAEWHQVLTDEDGGDDGIELSYDQHAALLAELDRIAGELTEAQSLCLSNAFGASNVRIQRELEALELTRADSDGRRERTPLGRAVLARTEGRR